MVNDSLSLLSYFCIFRSRGVVQIQSSLIFEPEKVNIFNKDCERGGKEVTCMSVTICLSLHSRTRTKAKPKAEVGEFPSKPHAQVNFTSTCPVGSCGQTQLNAKCPDSCVLVQL